MRKGDIRQPQRPKHIPEYAEVCLQALATGELGEKISLGGAFGLLITSTTGKLTIWMHGGSRLLLLRIGAG